MSRRGKELADAVSAGPEALSSHASGDAEHVLLCKARSGAAAAFMELMAPHRSHLAALIYRLLDDASEVPDVLQEVYLSAYRGLADFRGEAAFGTWVHRIAYNACLRYRARRPEVAEPTGAPEPTVADHADGTAARLDLAAALARLPLDQRALVLLVDCRGLSYQSAAEALDLPLGTVSSRLATARARLRRALSSAETGGDA